MSSNHPACTPVSLPTLLWLFKERIQFTQNLSQFHAVNIYELTKQIDGEVTKHEVRIAGPSGDSTQVAINGRMESGGPLSVLEAVSAQKDRRNRTPVHLKMSAAGRCLRCREWLPVPDCDF